jgi:hypothetical protein
MDLGTIKRRLESNYYLTQISQSTAVAGTAFSLAAGAGVSAMSSVPQPSVPRGFVFNLAAFASDVRLCFRNCMIYCPEQDVLFRCAKTLMEEFDEEMLEAPRPVPILPESGAKKPKREKAPSAERAKISDRPKKNRKRGATDGGEMSLDSGTNSASSKARTVQRRPSSLPSSPCVPDARTVKQGHSTKDCPPGRDGSDIEKMTERLEYLRRCRVAMAGAPDGGLLAMPMTFDEKSRLTRRMSAIPASKIGQLVAILSESKSSGGSGASDEIEVDMDKLSAVTLRKIEALVDSCVGSNVGGKKPKKPALDVDLSEFDGLEEVEREIAAISAHIEHARAAITAGKIGGLWDDSSSSESESESGSSDDSSDGESCDESDPE